MNKEAIEEFLKNLDRTVYYLIEDKERGYYYADPNYLTRKEIKYLFERKNSGVLLEFVDPLDLRL